MPKYVCTKNANDQGYYVVHELSCDFLPAVENQVNANTHDTFQGALNFLEKVNEGRGLTFIVCEHCGLISSTTTVL